MVYGLPISRSVILPSTPAAIVDVCKQVISNLEANKFSEEDVFAVHLCLEEAFVNAVKHGNRMEPSKAVKIDYSVDRDKIEISMTDEGKGFDPHVVPDPRYGDNLFRPAGRGLLLIRSYMDIVEYNDAGNSVRMVRFREKSHSSKSQAQVQA